VLGLLAEWCGMGPRGEISAAEFSDRFELAKLPNEAIVFTAEADAWLLPR